MRPGPFGRPGQGREIGFRCPRRVIAVIAAPFLAGCMSGDHGVKRMAGAWLGGVAGSVHGSTAGSGKPGIPATVAETMAGLFPGSGIGASLDKLYAARARQAALETRQSGVPLRWRNPNTGNAGATTPTRTDRSAGGIYCTEYQLP